MTDPASTPIDDREIELKLFVPPAALATALENLRSHPWLTGHAISAWRVARIDNRYFDTADRLLAQHRMALRLRRIGLAWFQTLKTSGAGDQALSARGEWEMPLPGPKLSLHRLRDTPLAALGSARWLTPKLHQVFTTNFRRETRLLRLSDGSEVECAIDLGLIACGRGRTRRVEAIGELELELKAGDPRALLRVAERLARDVPLIPFAASKAARGYRLAAGQKVKAVKVEWTRPEAGVTTRVYLSTVIAASAAALMANVHALVTSASAVDADTEFVHQARVAVRRLRSALRTFRPVIAHRRHVVVDDGARAIGRALGAVRDWDVFVEQTLVRIDAIAATDADGIAAVAALRVDAAARRAAARQALTDFLSSAAFGHAAIAIERFVYRLAAREVGFRDDALADLASGWLAAQQARVIERSRRIAVLDDEARHALRIEVKRLRYALDLFDALYATDAVDDYRAVLADLQEELGALNDAIVAQGLLASLGAGHELVRERFGEWLSKRIRKRLPKVGALSVALELTDDPWSEPPAIAAIHSA